MPKIFNRKSSIKVVPEPFELVGEKGPETIVPAKPTGLTVTPSQVNSFTYNADFIDVTGFGDATRTFKITPPTPVTWSSNTTTGIDWGNQTTVSNPGPWTYAGTSTVTFGTAWPGSTITPFIAQGEEIDEVDELGFAVTCWNGCEVSVGMDGLDKPCPMCNGRLNEFALEKITFKTR